MSVLLLERLQVASFDNVEADRKIAIICSKGSLDIAYPGLILANAALGEGVETHLFFTFWGFDIINKKTIAELDVPEIPDFLEQIVDSGGHVWACRMSADIQHLVEEDLYDALEGILSASDFIEKTVGAQLLFV